MHHLTPFLLWSFRYPTDVRWSREDTSSNAVPSAVLQVSHRCALEPGGYIIVPTTFEPSQEAQFTLRVFSMNAVKLRYIDTTPAVLRNPILKVRPAAGWAVGKVCIR